MNLFDLMISGERTTAKLLRDLRRCYLLTMWERGIDLDSVLAFEARSTRSPYQVDFQRINKNLERLSPEELIKRSGFGAFPTLTETMLYIIDACGGKKGGLPLEFVDGKPFACLSTRFGDGGVPLIRLLPGRNLLMLSWGQPDLFRDFYFHEIEIKGYRE